MAALRLIPPIVRNLVRWLPAEAAERLDEATRIDLGFPAGFIRDNMAWVFGAAALTAPGRRTR